ncbi:hypothetical protein GCM10023319_23520 [Nocardia iowensis]
MEYSGYYSITRTSAVPPTRLCPDPATDVNAIPAYQVAPAREAPIEDKEHTATEAPNTEPVKLIGTADPGDHEGEPCRKPVRRRSLPPR